MVGSSMAKPEYNCTRASQPLVFLVSPHIDTHMSTEFVPLGEAVEDEASHAPLIFGLDDERHSC